MIKTKTKQCKKCYKFKTLDNFRVEPTMKDGHRNECTDCRYIYMVEWRKNNTELRKAGVRRYELKLKNGEFPHRIQARRLRSRNSILIKKICNSKMSNQKLQAKESTFITLFGCSSKVFIERFERIFNLPKNRGMGWNNYGAWQLDHEKPMKDFTLDTKSSRRLCNHYTNIRPEWGLFNLKKSDKVNYKKTI